MRTIKQYIEAAKARKENGEEGFSLVELIVVVVILGILAAVAIPIFNGIQGQAQDNAVKAAAANAASQLTAQAAQNKTLAVADSTEFEYTVEGETGKVDSICVVATSLKDSTKSAASGPAATADGTSCTTATP